MTVVSRASSRWSLPVRECGLKFPYLIGYSIQIIVTPRAGVWIEMIPVIAVALALIVTPRAGVWIEIKKCMMC